MRPAGLAGGRGPELGNSRSGSTGCLPSPLESQLGRRLGLFVSPPHGVVDATTFVPYAWPGDNDRGLFWFCESDEMWPNAGGKDAIELVRGADEVLLRLNLLAPGQKLPANWKFVFGLQATPVKPIPKGLCKWRMSPGRNANLTVWPQPNRKDSLSNFGYPEAAHPTVFTEYIKGMHAKGLKAVPYLCLTFMTGAVPEWQYFRRLWTRGSADPSIPDAGWKHTFHMVSPVGKGYADFMMEKTKAFLERYDIDGVYHDQTHPYILPLRLRRAWAIFATAKVIRRFPSSGTAPCTAATTRW